jgi:hypothetical protein
MSRQTCAFTTWEGEAGAALVQGSLARDDVVAVHKNHYMIDG